jgi:hypothetical protein
MNFEQFRRGAQLNQELADYLDGVAQEANPGKADRSFALGVGMLFGVAVYGLYRMAKNYLDHKKGLSEAELRQEMLGQVEELVKSGWDRDKALAAVLAVSKDVASLRHDSPALEAALSLLKAGGKVSG